jgi:hypothetical protein
MNNPVGMMALSNGFISTGASSEALRSIPAEAAVSYAGNALSEVLTILILMAGFSKRKEITFYFEYKSKQYGDLSIRLCASPL